MSNFKFIAKHKYKNRTISTLYDLTMVFHVYLKNWNTNSAMIQLLDLFLNFLFLSFFFISFFHFSIDLTY